MAMSAVRVKNLKKSGDREIRTSRSQQPSREPAARAIIAGARADYESAAKERRGSRPDVLEMRVGELEERNAGLAAEVEQLRSELARANETRGRNFPVRLRSPDRGGRSIGP